MSQLTKKRINLGEVTGLKKILRGAGLSTVCENAKCPNIGECFGRGVATFLIAGNVCTRGCRFCAVDKGRPLPPDPGEPERVAATVRKLGLRAVVITSVTRDDLQDGGAQHFHDTVKQLRNALPGIYVEVLVPDFLGNMSAVELAASAQPDVFAHNLETVPRLYDEVRRGADYKRSLSVLSYAKKAGRTTKSGLMLGLGETPDEIEKVMDDLRNAGCDMLTLGQYLSPSLRHAPVAEYITEERFLHYKTRAIEKGFTRCVSAPYVRSSYRADEQFQIQ
ncbi:MAG: lipoyl synthase [Elusimicrobia bacterium RIFOXYA2_FULL_50_26]|nr:MAG: lipoyl synthase [Elusimicrobia bacterium RIFOXYA2_FULL_50_26]